MATGEPEEQHIDQMAEIVRRLRGKTSQEKFAADLGTSRQRVIAWEGAEAYPEKYATKLAEMAGVDEARLRRPKRAKGSQQTSRLEDSLSRLSGGLAELATAMRENEVRVARVDDRLVRLEATVDELARTTSESLAALQRGIDSIAQQPPGAEPRAQPNSTPRE